MVFISPLAFNGNACRTAYLLPELLDDIGIWDLRLFAAKLKTSTARHHRHYYEISKHAYEKSLGSGAVPIRLEDWFRWVEAKKQRFVFGSDRHGKHSGLTALHAVERYGAVVGRNAGVQGSSYCIPVWGHTIKHWIKCFVQHSIEHPGVAFFVTRIGRDLPGFVDETVWSLFADCGDNCVFEKRWAELLKRLSATRGEPETLRIRLLKMGI